HGLKVAWHNHDFEFFALADGSRPIDHIFDGGGDAVWFEIDCGWITRAGADPAAELKRFADRIIAIQMKDMAPKGTVTED
ncbi:sugar phosphate isomerase/epimerase, partial [Rhizobium ruizarguesonis]